MHKIEKNKETGNQLKIKRRREREREKRSIGTKE
jgi:hypothetical protein